ncbi:hypothetical protein QBC47DRAFT_87437 [Echria macrotheca]|uniref:GPI anchored serine-threonine rich protein n=1 Tax=Echria macrotheca TaxID=438768 RepID=A0AAJ0B348_9PEZI|nr:hypothetical protein QBC47DRAFT_87437 [Echria macrotheca]
MKAFFLPLAIFATATLAQDTACAANYIVEACLGTENGKLATCGTQDYVCRCNAFENILTCFNNCPNDPRKHDYEGQKQIFCGYASQFPSTTPKATGATTAPATSAETTAAGGSGSGSQGTANAGASNGGTATSTGAASGQTHNAAADLAMNAGSVLAAVAGVVAAVL